MLQAFNATWSRNRFPESSAVYKLPFLTPNPNTDTHSFAYSHLTLGSFPYISLWFISFPDLWTHLLTATEVKDLWAASEYSYCYTI